jgi:hypothetical protein
VELLTADQRSLLVVSYLEELADASLRWLYSWIEDTAVDAARRMLEAHYRTFSSLEGDDATYDNLIGRIETLASDPRVKAVDLFIHVHGTRGRLWLKDGPRYADDIGDDLYELDLREKLRALYSSACYGESHIDGFLRGGFRVASGAIGVNANGAAEYPMFMAYWADNRRFKTAINAVPAVLTRLQDDFASLKFPEANSEKVIGGKAYTQIMLPAI